MKMLNLVAVAFLVGVLVGSAGAWKYQMAQLDTLLELFTRSADVANTRHNLKLLGRSDGELRCLLARSSSTATAEQISSLGRVESLQVVGLQASGLPEFTADNIRALEQEYAASGIADYARNCEADVRLYGRPQNNETE